MCASIFYRPLLITFANSFGPRSGLTQTGLTKTKTNKKSADDKKSANFPSRQMANYCTDMCTPVEANHYDNFDFYILGNAKPLVGTSENMTNPDYDVIEMGAIMNFNANLLCFIISKTAGRFPIFRYQNVQIDKCFLLTSIKMAELNDEVSKMADILNLNENIRCITLLLILGHFEN